MKNWFPKWVQHAWHLGWNAGLETDEERAERDEGDERRTIAERRAAWNEHQALAALDPDGPLRALKPPSPVNTTVQRSLEREIEAEKRRRR